MDIKLIHITQILNDFCNNDVEYNCIFDINLLFEINDVKKERCKAFLAWKYT